VRLITAHRILIVAGIAFFAFYAIVQLRRSLAQSVVASAIVVGLVLYYRTLPR
jgi:hypothetical protein